MPMKIEEKIEEIRRKPDNIRLRYVWACVSFCMVFILVVWFFSFGFSNKSSNNQEIFQSNPLKEFQAQKENLEEYSNQLDTVKNNFSNLTQEIQVTSGDSSEKSSSKNESVVSDGAENVIEQPKPSSEDQTELPSVKKEMPAQDSLPPKPVSE